MEINPFFSQSKKTAKSCKIQPLVVEKVRMMQKAYKKCVKVQTFKLTHN